MAMHDRFLESEVLTADSLTLVRMLYRGAIQAVAGARQNLAAGQIGERSRNVVKAHAILHELSSSLDAAKGGEMSRNLRELYDYMQRRLNEANMAQSDQPLAEVDRLLRELSEAWQAISVPPAAVQPKGHPPADYVPLSLAG